MFSRIKCFDYRKSKHAEFRGEKHLKYLICIKKPQQHKLLNLQAVAHLEYSEITSERDESKWQCSYTIFKKLSSLWDFEMKTL